MTTVAATSRAALIAAIVLLSSSPRSRLTAQARGQGNRAAPSPSTPTGAPNSGYVVMPEPAPPGTVNPPLIGADPLELAYWELYDRDKQVTLHGKVTRVSWTSPNTYILLSASGTDWAIESSFTHFRQSSVSPAVRVGQTITVFGYLPKDEPPSALPAQSLAVLSSYLRTKHLIRAGEITTEYGQKLPMGRPLSEREVNERMKCSALGC